jgi:predicted ABC-type ATPase
MREVIILAGPNGAGKTTFANEYLGAAEDGLVFVNADEIAREASGGDPLSARTDIRAARRMLERIDSLAEARIEFMFETTLAGLT